MNGRLSKDCAARPRLRRLRALGVIGAATALLIAAPIAGSASSDPEPPTISSSKPAGPANDNNPVLNGTAEPGMLIKVFTGACPSGAPAATAVTDGAGDFQVAVTVPDNTTSTLSATATGVNPPKTSACSEPFTYTEDSLPPPVPLIASGPPTPSAATVAHFVFADGDPGVSFLCRLDGAAFAACSNPADVTVGDGTHTLSVQAVDAAGNVSAASAPYSWTVDTVHPLVSLTDKPPLLTNRTTVSFSFSADKPQSTFECKLDGGGFVSCSSPSLYGAIGDGSHTFAVRASSLGKLGLATEYTWTIDTLAPQTALSSTPPGRSGSAAATFTFAGSEGGSSFACRLDDAGFSACGSPKTYSNLRDGIHTFRVQAIDSASNADATPATYTWRISGGGGTADTTPPPNVRRLRRSISYGRLQLRWKRPASPDFDHVGVYVSTKPNSLPRTLVYKGRSQIYTNKRFKNALYYRYLIVSYDRAENGSSGMPTTIRPSVLLRSPNDGRLVHTPPLLRWRPVRNATFYNVQIYFRGQKIMSAWPSKPRQALARRWVYAGRRFTLRGGTYAWYVWPAFGARARGHYGQLLGRGSFRVR